jgi:hypothetical protein
LINTRGDSREFPFLFTPQIAAAWRGATALQSVDLAAIGAAEARAATREKSAADVRPYRAAEGVVA